MKIGDIEIKNVPPSERVACHNGCCASAVSYFNGTPLCAECLYDAQKEKWAEDGEGQIEIAA